MFFVLDFILFVIGGILLIGGLIAVGSTLGLGLGLFFIVRKIIQMIKKGNKSSGSSYSFNYKRHIKEEILTYSQTQAIDEKLRELFSKSNVVALNNKIELRLKGNHYTDLNELKIFLNGEFICDFGDLMEMDSEQYVKIYRLINSTNNHFNPRFESTPELTPQTVPDGTRSKEFIEKIQPLLTDIASEEINGGLQKTILLLNSVNKYELDKGEDINIDKLDKLYEYYLPILMSILNKYIYLSENDPMGAELIEARSKLAETVELINKALMNIISDFYSGDYLDISTDISTLQALLKKDGLISDSMMDIHSTLNEISGSKNQKIQLKSNSTDQLVEEDKNDSDPQVMVVGGEK